MTKKKVIVISGPSGVGKGSVITELLKRMPSLALTVSATTRQKRDGEINAKDYYFLSDSEFEKFIENDEFLEYCKVHVNYYGTLKSEVKRIQDSDKNVLIEMDVQGAKKIKEKVPDAMFLFIAPPNMRELENRLRNRNTEPEEIIQKRLNTAKLELQAIQGYNFVVINDSLMQTINEIEEIINNFN